MRGAEIAAPLGHDRLGVPFEEVGGAPEQVVTVEALDELAIGRHAAECSARLASRRAT